MQYDDGTEKETKFKKVEGDLREGKCVILS